MTGAAPRDGNASIRVYTASIVASFFETADEFASWLEKHGSNRSELIVGYYKRGTKRGTMSWSESVDAALCFGWIDGVRILRREGRMREAGLKAYGFRREEKSKTYSSEQSKTATLERGAEARFRKAKAAWKFFEAQPPSYRHLVVWRIVSAKRAETREKRLAALIKASQQRRRL